MPTKPLAITVLSAHKMQGKSQPIKLHTNLRDKGDAVGTLDLLLGRGYGLDVIAL